MARFWHTRAVRWGTPLIWMGVIFYLSSQSHLPNLTPGPPDLQPILGHLCSYAILAFLWRRALTGAGLRKPGWWALAIALLYGLSDEFHQSFVPHRNPELFDVAIDTIGAGITLLSAWGWRVRERVSGQAQERA